MNRPKKIHAAESIRGLACLAVVFSHLSLSFFPDLHGFDQVQMGLDNLAQWIHHSPFAFWFSGTAAVFVFFILSGYVLSYAICRQPNAILPKTRQMLVKRYPRLAIPVLMSCILVWLIFLLPTPDASHVAPWLQEYVAQDISLTQALYQGSIGSFLYAQSSVNWVLWTMQIELFGSLLIFALLVLRHFSVGVSLSLGAVALGCIAYLSGEGMLIGLACFYLGMLMYFYAAQSSSAMATVVLILGLYFAGVHDNSWSYTWITAILADKTYDYANLLGAALIVYSILFNPKLSQILDRPALVDLGKYSFAIYLLHLPLLYLIALPILNQLIAWGLPLLAAQGLCIVMYMLALLFIAARFSHYVDQGAIQVSQRVANAVEKLIQSGK